MSVGYGYEKLWLAVVGMAQSPAPLRKRLSDAYTFNLMHIRPEENLPADLRAAFADIQADFRTTAAEAGEGTAAASARAMSDDTAEEVARKIVSLFDQISAADRA